MLDSCLRLYRRALSMEEEEGGGVKEDEVVMLNCAHGS